MASGALPPGFPAIAIEEPGPVDPARDTGKPRGLRWFWDGGLVSNTPLSQVLDGHPRQDTLAFQVDLWSARGKVPTNVIDAQERVKDIQYSSRTRTITDTQAQEQRQRRLLRELLERIPPEVREFDPACRAAAQQATARCVSVIQLIWIVSPPCCTPLITTLRTCTSGRAMTTFTVAVLSFSFCSLMKPWPVPK